MDKHNQPVQQNEQLQNDNKQSNVAKNVVKTAAAQGAGVAAKALAPILIKVGLGLALTGSLVALAPMAVEALKGNSKIDDTANVVEEVKKIGEFVSACYYEELVVTQTKTSEDNSNEVADSTQTKGYFKKMMGSVSKMMQTESQIVFITKGKMRAGFDLQKLTENDFKFANDTLFLTLPPAETFDVIMNPSDIRVMYESGKWSHEEMTDFVVMAKDSMLVNAKNIGFEEKAKESGIKKMETMFATFGFPNVVIDIKK